MEFSFFERDHADAGDWPDTSIMVDLKSSVLNPP